MSTFFEGFVEIKEESLYWEELLNLYPIMNDNFYGPIPELLFGYSKRFISNLNNKDNILKIISEYNSPEKFPIAFNRPFLVKNFEAEDLLEKVSSKHIIFIKKIKSFEEKYPKECPNFYSYISLKELKEINWKEYNIDINSDENKPWCFLIAFLNSYIEYKEIEVSEENIRIVVSFNWS